MVGYFKGGKTKVLPFGRFTYELDSHEVTKDTVYDVASITKSIPTSCLVLHLIESSLLSLDDKVIHYIPEISNEYRNRMLVRHLLTYTVIYDMPPLGVVAKEHPDAILEQLFAAPLKAPPGERFFYTNAPALLMGLLAERISKKPLNELADQVYSSLPMPHTSFSTGWVGAQAVAPTERDWRGEVQGSPHDEAAWILRDAGRIAGHAGLFTTARDLLVFARMLLNQGAFEGRRYFEPATIEQMHTNQIASIGESAGLGWELRQALLPKDLGSNQVFGKTGFTGCVIVIDPKANLAFTYLSNRTYPTRPPNREAIISFRHSLARLLYA